MKKKSVKRKEGYTPPSISQTTIALESSIAAGSANVNTADDNGQVKDNWATDSDNDQNVAW